MRMDSCTSSSVTLSGGGSEAAGGGGRAWSAGAGGCFWRRVVMTSSVGSTNVSLGVRRRRPARMSPSAHFARMRRARESEASLCGADAFRCSFTGGGREGAESSSATCLFKCEASVTRFSPFLGEPGAHRATKAKDKNFHHDDGDVGLFSASLISDESASAITGRAALGIREITLVRARSFAKPTAMPQAGTWWFGG